METANDETIKKPKKQQSIALLIIGALLGVGIDRAWISAKLIQSQSEYSAQGTTATILYEPQSENAGIPLLNGMVQLSLGPKLGNIPTLTGMAPRWFIPGKVRPTFVGNPAGIQIFYFDQKTKRMDGPYLPEIVNKQ